jgi:hypothetical protein
MKTALIILAVLAGLGLIIQFFVSRTLAFKEELIIEASIEDAWEIMGNQFAEPHIWSTNFITSEPGGNPKLKGLAYLHRATTTENGDNWQELDAFNPANHSLSYHISKGVPPIAKSAIGHWKLTKITDNRTQLNVDFFLETKGLLGFIMSPIVSKKVGRSSDELMEEFKYYVENGKPHPRKLEAINM